ncbi:MAG: hypothetical protein ACOC40_02720 [Thermoplasmatota archaeon]
MAFEARLFNVPGTLVAGADLSTSQYKIVKLSDENTINVCTSTSDKPLGVLQNDPSSGEIAEVMAIGVTKIQVNSSLNAGDVIGTSTDAQALNVDPTSTANAAYTMGSMLKDVSAAGNIGTAFIDCINAPYSNI